MLTGSLITFLLIHMLMVIGMYLVIWYQGNVILLPNQSHSSNK